MPFLPVFSQKPSCGLVFKAVAVSLVYKLSKKGIVSRTFFEPTLTRIEQNTAQKSVGK